MSEVRCYCPWDEKKAKSLIPWLEKDEQRYLVFLDPQPSETFHPRIRCVAPSDFAFQSLSQEFLFLPFSYEQSHPLLKRLSEIQSEVQYRASDYADQGVQLIKNIEHHLRQPTHLAHDLYGKFSHVPALICGGGPSLSKVKIPEGALVIGCGAGVQALLKRGVQPHFAAHVDPHTLHTMSEVEIPLLYQLRTDHTVTEKTKGPHFLSAGAANFPLEKWAQEQIGIESSLDGGWTVGTFGVMMAYLMGCNTIVLAGLDFATTGTLYAPGVKTEATIKNFVPMKNRQGKAVLSRPDWVMAAQWLSAFALAHPEISWGTFSSEGLEIQGIPVVEEMKGGATFEIPKTPLVGPFSGIDFAKPFQICQMILQQLEKSFPQLPDTSALDKLLSQELAYSLVLEPIWDSWLHVMRRHNKEGEMGLYINKIVFFRSICEKFV